MHNIHDSDVSHRRQCQAYSRRRNRRCFLFYGRGGAVTGYTCTVAEIIGPSRMDTARCKLASDQARGIRSIGAGAVKELGNLML